MGSPFQNTDFTAGGQVRADPAVKFRFDVICGFFGRIIGSFSKISGIKEQIEVVDMRDGTDPQRTKKLVGTHQGGTIVLEKGVTGNVSELVGWFNRVKKNDRNGFRSDIAIGVADCANRLARVVKLQDAWPSAYELGDLDAKSSEVEVESLTLVFESLEFDDEVIGRHASALLDLFQTQSG